MSIGGISSTSSADYIRQLQEARAAAQAAATQTMAIIPPDTDPIWDYRRSAVTDALAAARRLLPGQP